MRATEHNSDGNARKNPHPTARQSAFINGRQRPAAEDQSQIAFGAADSILQEAAGDESSF
jgi:hypothetical protein